MNVLKSMLSRSLIFASVPLIDEPLMATAPSSPSRNRSRMVVPCLPRAGRLCLLITR